jgi:hypothetical protein
VEREKDEGEVMTTPTAAVTPTPEAPPTDEELRAFHRTLEELDGADFDAVQAEWVKAHAGRSLGQFFEDRHRRALYDHGARRERDRIVARLRARARVHAACGSSLESMLYDELAYELESE